MHITFHVDLSPKGGISVTFLWEWLTKEWEHMYAHYVSRWSVPKRWHFSHIFVGVVNKRSESTCMHMTFHVDLSPKGGISVTFLNKQNRKDKKEGGGWYSLILMSHYTESCQGWGGGGGRAFDLKKEREYEETQWLFSFISISVRHRQQLDIHLLLRISSLKYMSHLQRISHILNSFSNNITHITKKSYLLIDFAGREWTRNLITLII